MSNAPIYLSIADFIYELKSGDLSRIHLDEGFDDFYAQTERQLEIDTRIECFGSVPEALKKPTKSLYKAASDSAILWEIFDHPNGLQFLIYNPDDPSILQQIALFNEENQNWTVYSESKESNGEAIIFPLQYPLAPLIIYYTILRRDAIMIHASGLFDGKLGRAFSGFSGVGKSTLARLWNERGSMVINDDRLIIRKIKGEYWMYNTPMHYTDESRKTPLHRIYLPYHSPENKFELLTGVRAIAEMMAFCIQHGFRKENTSAHFDFVAELTKKLPVSKIGVVPTTEIVDFIRAKDAEMD